MIVTFKIGNLPGENQPESFIQDSVFGSHRLVYWLINDQPNTDFTQDKSTRRATWNQMFNNGDNVICHLEN